MRVYVATRFGLWETAAVAHAELERAGHEPTSQWVDIARELGGNCEAVPVGDPRRLENLVDGARLDVQDLERSDALIVLVPPEGGTGMWFELGWAAAKGVSCLLVGASALERCVFCELFDVAPDFAAALAWLEDMAPLEGCTSGGCDGSCQFDDPRIK